MKKSGVFLLLLLASELSAQILDDSTKLVYGPTTTRYTYENNIKFNNLLFNQVDTSIINIHRFNTAELSNYSLQDLGIIGTATRNIYYKPPSIIGARSGFYVYEPFFKPPEEFRYYDTKSPYSRIGAAVGGKGRSRVDVGFNRSDSSNFNVGIDYKRIIGDKQTNALGRRDRLTDSEGFDGYLLYFTPNRKYLVLSNFSQNKNTIIDQGGIDTTGGFSYFDENTVVFLQGANSEYLRKNFHFYQQLNTDSAFQIYQSYDWSSTSARFGVADLKPDASYFDQFNISTDSTTDANTFVTNTLETGVKGTLGKLFYLGYYKIRGYDFTYKYQNSDTLNFRELKPNTIGIEHYVGGMIRLQLNSKYKFTGAIDFNLNGNQRLTGDLMAANFDVRFLLQQNSPSYMEQAYLGNHDYWINDFKNVKTLELEGGYRLKVGNIFLRPKANFSTVTDYIYFNQQAVPEQIDGTTTLIRPGIDLAVNFMRDFNVSGSAEYTIVSGSGVEAFPIPALMLNVNIYYHRLLFGDNLELQAGLDNHWKSDYFAQDYRVSSQQFFIQSDVNISSYLISDAYVNIKLGHAYVFFKFNNLVQVFTKEGYLVAPNYIGKPAVFDFGFYWQFYD